MVLSAFDPAPAPDPASAPRPRIPSAVLALAIFVASVLLGSWRIGETIDINSDEATYAIESVALYQTGMTRWNGAPFLVHPPAFFSVEALYFRLRGIGSGPLFQRLVAAPYTIGVALLPPDAPPTDDDVFHAIVAGRYLSVVYGAGVVVLLFLLGLQLGGRRIGLAAAALAVIDPYLLRRNHYNMLEPLTTLFGLAMLLVYARALDQPGPARRRRYLLAAGLLLGLALLSKEIAVLYTLPLLVHALLFRRAGIRDLLAVGGLAAAIYALFPLWAALSGNFALWWSTKTWLFQRLVGVIHDTGITRPGKSLTNPSLGTIADYWTSFTILGLAGVLAALWVVVYLRRGLRDPGSDLLAAVILGGYGFFIAVWRLGGVLNEQFFYLIMPLAILAVIYAGARWRGYWQQATAGMRWARGLTRAAGLGTVLLAGLGVLLLYDLGHGILRYGFSRDDSYAQVDGYLARTLPPGAGVVGRDALDLYLLPRNPVYVISFLANTAESFVPLNIAEKQVPVAILNEQALAEHYNGANEIFYNWVQENGDRLTTFHGRRWQTAAYRIDYARAGASRYGANSLSAGRPATASSVEDPAALPAQNAFDARITTRWASAVGDQAWIAVDLGQRQHIGRVDLTWETAYAEHYALEVSDDGRTWTTFYQTTHGQGGVEQVTGDTAGRYVRLQLSQRATPYGYSLWEISVYP